MAVALGSGGDSAKCAGGLGQGGQREAWSVGRAGVGDEPDWQSFGVCGGDEWQQAIVAADGERLHLA